MYHLLREIAEIYIYIDRCESVILLLSFKKFNLLNATRILLSILELQSRFWTIFFKESQLHLSQGQDAQDTQHPCFFFFAKNTITICLAYATLSLSLSLSLDAFFKRLHVQ